jgi:copper transport protein
MKKLLFSVTLALLVLMPASAHGFLVRAVPDDGAVLDRAPARVQYWFSESLEPAFSKLTVRDANGEIVATGGTDPDAPTLLSAALPNGLSDGAYIVDLRLAFASDGHVITETRVFFIGVAVAGVRGGTNAQADPAEILWRASTLTGVILAFGAALLYSWVLRPAWGSISHRAGGLPPRVMGRLTAVAFGGLMLALVAQVGALLHQSVVFFGVPLNAVLSQSLWSVVRTSTRFGEVWNARMIVLAVCAAMIGAAWLYRKSNPELTRPMWSASLWGTAIALGASSVISHAAGSRTAAWAALMLDWIHLIAVAAWVGGLAALVFVLPAAQHGLDRESARKALLAALRRFSPVAAACLPIVIATGVFSASLWVRPDDLVSTEYGLALLVKLAMAAGLVGLGAVHYAALRGESSEPHAGITSNLATVGRWLRTLRLEVVFAALTLIGAGWLTAAPVPVPEDAAQTIAPLTARAEIPAANGQQPYAATMTVSPGGPGVNTFDLIVTRGELPVNAAVVEMQSSHPSRDMRGAWTELQPLDNGAYSTVLPDIDRTGEWWSLLDIALDSGETVRAAFAWDIRAEAAIEPSLPLNAIQAVFLMAALAALGYAALPAARRIYRWLNLTPQGVTIALIATIGTLAASAAGLVYLNNEDARYQDTVNPPPPLVNTVLPDAASLERGEIRLAEACAGWTPDSPGWDDLVARLPRTRDVELFTFLTDGFRGLPACSPLSDRERWDIVNTLRAALRS